MDKRLKEVQMVCSNYDCDIYQHCTIAKTEQVIDLFTCDICGKKKCYINTYMDISMCSNCREEVRRRLITVGMLNDLKSGDWIPQRTQR